MSNWLQSRQVRAGSYSGLYIVVFVAILVALNYLADQYNKTFDATKDQLYSLSDQTHKILDNLENDVTIYYFDRARSFPAAKNSLVRYENASNRVTVKYIDPESDVGTAQTMNVRNFGTVMVEMGANREEASTTGEEEVTNAIIKLLKGGDKKACIVTGHGEADPANSEQDGFSIAQGEIQNANYGTETVSLAQTGEVPTDCTVVVVAGPSAGYFEPEVAALRNYVNGGGRLLLMLDGTVEEESSQALIQLAAEWGVKVGSDIVIDLSPVGQLFGGGPLTPLIAEYDTVHAITKVMGNVASLFPMTRSVVEEGASGGWTVTELMKTTESSFSTTDFEIADGELVRKPQAETPGPINVAATATMDLPDDAPEPAEGEAEENEAIPADEEESKQARVVVTGSSRFARNSFVGRGGNADLFLNMLSWLSSDEDLISIRPKDPANTPMDITESQMRWLLFGLVLGLPLAIVVAGVRSWWVRR
jgi:ABC-type uncharacterized transport system involved in gliding motility auxiliary subunit